MGQVIGIDFGTTTTEVSYIKDNGVRSLKLEDGQYYIPTVLFFKSEDDYIIGHEAEKYSRNQDYSEAVVRNFKLDLTSKNIKYNVVAKDGTEFSVKPQKAAQLFLNRLLQIIQPKLIKIFGDKEGIIDKAVITVPALFNPVEKEAIKSSLLKAARNAGFNEIKVAAEPTAAAVAYSDNENIQEEQSILVYDFGGGTFDVSVIRKSRDKFEEIETDGDKALGGNLLTEKIAEYLWYDFCDNYNMDELPFEKEDAMLYSEEEYGLAKSKYNWNRSEFITIAEEIKLQFSGEEQFVEETASVYNMQGNLINVTLSMTYDVFKKIIKKVINKTISITADVVQRTDHKIDYFVLAGGSSAIKMIYDLISEHPVLKCLNLCDDDDSQTLISRGAAILANAKLSTDEKTRFELGISAREGAEFNAFIPIIGAGVSFPCTGKKRFSIDKKGFVKICYFEKDVKKYPNARRAGDNGIELVSEFQIEVPDSQNAELEVTFNIEKDGTPSISAVIVDSSNKMIASKEIVIKRDGELW